jgi:hypothetical protein
MLQRYRLPFWNFFIALLFGYFAMSNLTQL